MGLPFLLADVGGVPVGFAYASKWKGRCAFRHTAETTVYVGREHWRCGVGTALYTRLLGLLQRAGYHAAIGGIALPNESSITLHERLGFAQVALFREVGFKFNGWIDVGYWQLLFESHQLPWNRGRTKTRTNCSARATLRSRHRVAHRSAASACTCPKTESIGQDSRLAHTSNNPLITSKAVAMPKTAALCSLSHINCGKFVISPTTAAPAPSDTITAGRTQQTSVVELARTATAAPRLSLPPVIIWASSSIFHGLWKLAFPCASMDLMS